MIAGGCTKEAISELVDFLVITATYETSSVLAEATKFCEILRLCSDSNGIVSTHSSVLLKSYASPLNSDSILRDLLLGNESPSLESPRPSTLTSILHNLPYTSKAPLLTRASCASYVDAIKHLEAIVIDKVVGTSAILALEEPALQALGGDTLLQDYNELKTSPIVIFERIALLEQPPTVENCLSGLGSLLATMASICVGHPPAQSSFSYLVYLRFMVRAEFDVKVEEFKKNLALANARSNRIRRMWEKVAFHIIYRRISSKTFNLHHALHFLSLVHDQTSMPISALRSNSSNVASSSSASLTMKKFTLTSPKENNALYPLAADQVHIEYLQRLMHYVEENHKHTIFSALFLEIDLPPSQRLINFNQLVRFPAIIASSFDIDLATSRLEDIFKLFCSPRCTLLFKELCATSSLDVAKRIGCIGESVLHKLGNATVSKNLREKFEEFCVAFVDVLSKSIYRFVFVICI